MNIKKIIKEEIDSFDWTEDISAYTPMPSKGSEPNRTVYESGYQEENHRIMWDVYDKCVMTNVGWQVCPENWAGVLEWYNDNHPQYVIYATPHYNEENVIPIALVGPNDDDYINIDDVNVPDFEFVEEAEKWYKEEYPKLIKDTIKRMGYAWLFRGI